MIIGWYNNIKRRRGFSDCYRNKKENFLVATVTKQTEEEFYVAIVTEKVDN